jgi:asparagine synthase (glutamine-hydrolysing)
MCGICGAVDFRGAGPLSRATLVTMVRRLRHRGPDSHGLYRDERAALGHARLSIVDLEGGAQPMSNEDGSLWVVFNGEIYNHVELRPALEARGHRFRTRCDTEVLLHLYEELGEAALAHLNGQFAFALWDRLRGRLFLARDRFGVRPLYYTWAEGRFAFASEVKSLAAVPGVSLRLDPRGIAQCFHLWSPLPPTTAFAGVYQILPGHFVEVGTDREREGRYWSPPFSPDREEPERTVADWVEEVRAQLQRAMRLRMRADVPVAAYLSGGLDSSLTTAMIRRHTDTNLDTFSVRFEDRRYDEGEHQDTMVAHLGTNHRSVSVGAPEIARAFPEVIAHTEAPVLRTAPVPLFHLSRLVRDSGIKVVVTGEGADEVFGGYEIFKETLARRFWARDPDSPHRPKVLSRLYPYIPHAEARRAQAYWQGFFAQGLRDTDDPFYSHVTRWKNTIQLQRFFRPEIQAELVGVDPLAALRSELPADFDRWAALSKAQFVEMRSFMSGYLLSSQGDRVSMAHSVEGRYPFLDHELCELCARIPPRHRLKGLEEKHVLRRAAVGYVPESVRRRRKQPFRAPDSAPFAAPSEEERTRALLTSQRIARAGIFQPNMVSGLLERCIRNRARGVSARDDMALVGVLSTQILHERFVATPWPDEPGGPPFDVDVDLSRDARPTSVRARQPALSGETVAPLSDIDGPAPWHRIAASHLPGRKTDMKEQIREYILENCMYGAPPEDLEDDVSFLETGILDSTGVMELIAFIEEEFGFQVDDTEMVPNNLDSVRRLCAYVERKTSAA